MAAKKKTKKKRPASKQTAAKNRKPVKKTVQKQLAKKKASPKKKSVRKLALKKAVKAKVSGKKKSGGKTARATGKRAQERNQGLDPEVFAPQGGRSRSAGQSGDLQGLSDFEGADSESVDELVEEGNAFEADVVAGMERAGDADEEEVHTHEVPEDDVPGEYLDKD
jgi:hypothetical protein